MLILHIKYHINKQNLYLLMGKCFLLSGKIKYRYYNTVGTSGGLASYISIATNDGITNDHHNVGDDIQNVDWLVPQYCGPGCNVDGRCCQVWSGFRG